MTLIVKRIEKLESALLGEKGIEFENLTPDQRQHRIAQLIYKGLFDTNPEVGEMTEEEFVSLYIKMSDEEREYRGFNASGKPSEKSTDKGEGSTELLESLRSELQKKEG